LTEMDRYWDTKFTILSKHALQPFMLCLNEETNVAQLNRIANRLLAEHTSVQRSQTFDFLVNGSLFTDVQTLGTFIAEHNLSTEHIIEIECVQRVPEPVPYQVLKHQEWVSDAQATKRLYVSNEIVLSACYDGTVNAWNYEGDRLSFLKYNNERLKALCLIPDRASQDMVKFAAGSADQTVFVGAFHCESNKFSISKIGFGHEESVECVAACSDGLKLASGGSDSYLKIWDIANMPLNFENDPNEQSAAFRTDSRKKMTPMFTLAGHRDQIAGVCWKSPAEVVTASWDHSIHVWDVELIDKTCALSGDCCFTDIAYSSLNGLLLSSCSDCSVRMWDLRSSEGSMVKGLFKSHQRWASSVDWSKSNVNLFLSSDYAGLLKLWDIRNAQSPLYDLKSTANKMLCCDYSIPEYLIGGGTDGCLAVFKAM
ncbi:Ribosome biogenesis protein WDR12 -like protein, partial [Trichinella pseudospiralis]